MILFSLSQMKIGTKKTPDEIIKSRAPIMKSMSPIVISVPGQVGTGAPGALFAYFPIIPTNINISPITRNIIPILPIKSIFYSVDLFSIKRKQQT